MVTKSAEDKGDLRRTVAVLSGLGSFLMSILAVIGVIVYQTNSNTELKTEVTFVKEAIPGIRNDIKSEIYSLKTDLKENRKDIVDEMSKRLKSQDEKIEELRKEVAILKLKVGVLESK